MEEKSRTQELSVREISLIRELAQIRKEHKRELEYEKFDGYELPPRTQFSMLNKPAVSIKYGVMKFNMACIRLFEGIKYVLPILHPNKKRLALIMCPEEDSASVEWARQKDENWVNKDITSLEFVENIFRLIQYNRALIPNKILEQIHLMTSDVIIIRFPDPILIDIREKLYLFLLHFASKRVCIFLWLRCEHDCFFQIEQHTKALI